jgi:predicted Zn-dependent protease
MRFALVLSALVAVTVLAAMHRAPSSVGLNSLRQLWSDALRDADQPGLRLTRLSDAEEMRMGTELAGNMPAAEDPAAVVRLTAIARPMLDHLRRRGIRYQFHITESSLVNAFALPGGQVIVTTGLLDFVRNDSELAEVLGHEIAHIDLRHAVGHYQYQYRLGPLVEVFHRLVTMPYTADQELDADAEGLRLMATAGYDPVAGAAVFDRMRKQAHEPPSPPRANTPPGELQQSLEGALVSYFRTHPPSEERARRLRELAARASRTRESTESGHTAQ